MDDLTKNFIAICLESSDHALTEDNTQNEIRCIFMSVSFRDILSYMVYVQY